jgi:hypothetical protein
VVCRGKSAENIGIHEEAHFFLSKQNDRNNQCFGSGLDPDSVESVDPDQGRPKYSPQKLKK